MSYRNARKNRTASLRRPDPQPEPPLQTLPARPVGKGFLLPPRETREAIAEGVHRAIADELGGEGFGLCAWYTLAGYQVATRLTGTEYVPQAGSLRLTTSEREGWEFLMDPETTASPGLEYHAWFVAEHPGRVIEVVDLTSRFYRTWAERSAPDTSGAYWDIPDFPPFLWERSDRLRSELTLRCQRPVLAGLFKLGFEHQSLLKALVDRAAEEARATLSEGRTFNGR